MDDNRKKIYFTLESNETESLWAVQQGHNFEIRNVPFFAYGIAFGDIVEATLRDNNFYFQRKISDSGHSAYRVFTDRLSDDIDLFFSMLENEKCTYERATENLYAIDVPPEANIIEVYKILELGEQRKVWEFEEAYCRHVTKQG